ncbi:hypothetical protein [Bacillus cabrialesii]
MKIKETSINDEQLKRIGIDLLNFGLLYIRSISGTGHFQREQAIVNDVCYRMSDALHNLPEHLIYFNRLLILDELEKLALTVSRIPKTNIVQNPTLQLIVAK